MYIILREKKLLDIFKTSILIGLFTSRKINSRTICQIENDQ